MFVDVPAQVEYVPLKQYEVVFYLKGKKFSEVIGANSTTDARELIRSRHGEEVKIVSVREVKKK